MDCKVKYVLRFAIPGKVNIIRLYCIEMTKVKRHQMIYKTLVETMKEIHALSIQAFTIQEFNANPIILSSPDCSNK